MTQITDQNLRIEIDQEHGPLLFFFEQPNAAACRWVAPNLVTILSDFPGVRLIRVDAGEDTELCKRFSVPRVPHVSFVRNGKPQAALTGVYTSVYLRRWLEEQLHSA